MNNHIELHELAKRESERVEWKENVRKRQMEPWDRRINPQSTFEHIDLIAIPVNEIRMACWKRLLSRRDRRE